MLYLNIDSCNLPSIMKIIGHCLLWPAALLLYKLTSTLIINVWLATLPLGEFLSRSIYFTLFNPIVSKTGWNLLEQCIWIAVENISDVRADNATDGNTIDQDVEGDQFYPEILYSSKSKEELAAELGLDDSVINRFDS